MNPNISMAELKDTRNISKETLKGPKLDEDEEKAKEVAATAAATVSAVAARELEATKENDNSKPSSSVALMALNDTKAGMQGLDKEKINAIIEVSE